MARLPLGEWDTAVAERRLEFLKAAAYFVPPVAVPLPDDERDRQTDSLSERITDNQALFAAGELAFAIDRTPDGVSCLRDAVTDILRHGDDPKRAALAGAIVGTIRARPLGDVYLIERLTYSEVVEQHIVDRPLMTPGGMNLLLDLVLAGLASGVPLAEFERISVEGLETLPPDEAIVQALAVFDTDRSDRSTQYDVAHKALSVNAGHWAYDLRLHRRDRYHWRQARIRGQLIDMRRLAFEIALRQWPEVTDFMKWHRERIVNGVAGQLEVFVAELADEILRQRENRPG